jgi:hypothetical protein
MTARRRGRSQMHLLGDDCKFKRVGAQVYLFQIVKHHIFFFVGCLMNKVFEFSRASPLPARNESAGCRPLLALCIGGGPLRRNFLQYQAAERSCELRPFYLKVRLPAQFHQFFDVEKRFLERMQPQ